MENKDNILPYDGEVFYHAHFFSAQESDRFLTALTEEIPWRQEPIILFGKKVMQPRLTAWFGDESYTYSGITMSPQKWTPTLLLIKKSIEEKLGLQFNSALLNQYRDGNDSMGWHQDDEKELGTNPTICSLSFGAPRDFQLRHIKNKDLKVSVNLGHGSALVMQGATQHHWAHALPKRKRTLQPRINITFRQIKKV